MKTPTTNWGSRLFRNVQAVTLLLLTRWTVKLRTVRQRRTRKTTCGYETLEPRVCLAPLIPFSKDAGVLYQIHGVRGEQGQLSEIDLTSDLFVDIGQRAGFKINGTGFRTADGYIYGIKMDTDELIRLGATGEHEILGAIAGLPDGNYFTGDFASDGRLYVRHRNTFYGINVDNQTVERVVTATEDVHKTYDIAYNPVTELHYSIRKNGRRAEFVAIDLTTDSDNAVVNVIHDDFKPVGTFGALFSDAAGRVFAANNAGGLYEVDANTGQATFAGYSPRASSNDGSFSAEAVINLPPVAANDWISTLTGDHVVDLNTTPPYDLEGDSLTIRVSQLPDFGMVTQEDGTPVQPDQLLTINELTHLKYQSPESADSFDGTPVGFVYSVSDGYQSAMGSVDIHFAGLSRITGQVIVMDDTEESSYEGYVLNNEIQLTGEDILGNSVEQRATTDVNGEFEFSQLAPGEYQIVQTQPPTVFDGFVEMGELPGTPSQNTAAEVVIPTEPRSFDGLTFVEEAPTQISGFVYVDVNGNNQIDVDEHGIGNVTITLDGVDNQGESIQRVATTDSYGFYEIRNLRAGTYNLTQQQPDGYINAQINVGDLGGTVGDNQVIGIVTSAGQGGTKYHFGEYESSSLAGSVFLDDDIDNAFDQGDLPFANVTIELTGIDLLGNAVVREIQTDSEGNYLVDDLMAGTYDLFATPIDEYPDGQAHLGIFNNDETVLDSNGTALKNRIVGIETGVGRHGRSFNFSKHSHYGLVKQFDNYFLFEGTDANDEFEFIAGDETHSVIFNGVLYEYDVGENQSFTFKGYSGEDQVHIRGSEKVEQLIYSGDIGKMVSENWRVQFVQSEHITVQSGAGYDRAFLYDTDQDDRIKMTQDYARMWNQILRIEVRGFHRTYAYAENGGEDRVYHYDSKYDDTVKMTSTNSRVIGRKFYNFARDFERNYAFSVNGGDDRAQFWDSASDQDTFQAHMEYGRMYNEDFYNFAEGFGSIDVFGVIGGENDRAFLHGTEGEDILLSSPARSGLSGHGYQVNVHRFERIYAHSGGGEADRAYLFDSKLDDRFIAGPSEAKLYNDDYFLKAVGFPQVDAYSSRGGNDRAYFNDSDGTDTLITLETESRMFGDGFDNTTHGFSRTYVQSSAGGDDVALLYDSQHADTIKITDDLAKMYGENYYTWLSGFSLVRAEFTKANRYDRALVFGDISESTLTLSGELSGLIFDHAAEFVHDPDADNQDDYGPDDFERVSLRDLLAEIDLDKD